MIDTTNFPSIPINDNSKLILFSDCHRGIGDWADDLAHNQLIYFHALRHYYEQSFTYVEIGDGDELVENKSIGDIRDAHSDIFWLLREFQVRKRLCIIVGNHNWDKRAYERDLALLGGRTGKLIIHPTTGLVLTYNDSPTPIIVTHGHQVDKTWYYGRIVTRYLWRPLQMLGVRDPTSPATSKHRCNHFERELVRYVEENEGVLIAGHTHRPRFGVPHKRYFNTGCCTHPRCIVGIEIEKGEMRLIKWAIGVDYDGRMCVERTELDGPVEVRGLCR